MLRDNHHVLAEAIFKSINDRSILDLDKLSWTTGKLNLSTEKMLRNQLSPVPLR
jgi:hypothetical protein